MNLEHHPCFSVAAHRTHGRVHLPVAPRCNIQCKFCNRKFDCVNESRPGVTSGIVTPDQAMLYLETVFARKKNISVVGIAGPGDPFANPKETIETLERVRAAYPEIILCVATNGLNLLPYLDDLVRLQVSHVTVTVNAVDPSIGARIYSWVRYNRRVLPAENGVRILLQNQTAAIEGLKSRGVAVKINSIVIPGINEQHIETIAEHMGKLNVDILNCVPYYPSKGSAFEHLAEPSRDMIRTIQSKAARFVKQMRHCTRCRADAVGLLGAPPDIDLMRQLQACERTDTKNVVIQMSAPRPYVAVASMEGVLVNQHLGEAASLLIFGKEDGRIRLIESRDTPDKGGGSQRWSQLANMLLDCRALLVSGVGEKPKQALRMSGIEVHEIDGLISDAVHAVINGESLRHLVRRQATACGAGCGGGGTGCG